MVIIEDFDIRVDKYRVFDIIDCKKDSPVYDKVDNLYREVFDKALRIIEPKGIFRLEKTPCNFNYEAVKGYSHLVSCLVTLGEEVSLAVSKDFENGYYLEGLLLDTISDEILSKIGQQLRDKVINYIKTLDLGLTCRMSPGDKDIPIEIQRDILFRVSGKEKLGVDITDGYMLNPLKSLAYFYGADEKIQVSPIDHDCSKCNRIDCKFRRDNDINLSILTEDGEQLIKVSNQKNVLEILIENGIRIEAPCSGNGTCGKCKVEIVEGNSQPTQNEMSILSEDEINNNIRLACLIYPKENLKIKLESLNYADFHILSDYREESSVRMPTVEVKGISAVKSKLCEQRSLTHKINEGFSQDYDFSLKALQKLATSVNRDFKYAQKFSLYEEEEYNLIIYKNKVLDVCKVKDTSVFGIAVDIGTTTIAIALIDILNCKTLGIHTILNSQRQYGADVISRIQYSVDNGLQPLTNCIRKDVLGAIEKVCSSNGVDFKKIYNVTIAGNTTMVYLLLGIPPQSLALSPFTTTTTSLLEYDFREVFNDESIDCKVNILPCISAYIGADIVSGMLNYNFDDLRAITMLIDIGTNGEVVIGDRDKIYCASTAAGPAFEGANIRDGIGSIKGAIYSVQIKEEDISFKTLGGEKPIGICGSGVIDLVASALKGNIIDNTGRFNKKYQESPIEIFRENDKRICFYQKDIRELQLAKSALRSGIDALIKKFDCSYDDIETVYLAGGFGNNLRVESAIDIGLLPGELREKIKLAGNSSLGGAVDFLLNKKASERINNIVSKSVYYELSLEADFSNLFIENMLF